MAFRLRIRLPRSGSCTDEEEWVDLLDHTQMSNRDALDSHPQGAITDLVQDQATQDDRLDNLELHPPRTDNPHGVNHAQLPDVTGPAANPHGMVRWAGVWQPGEYQEHDMVLDGDWTQIANKITTERAAPQAVGEEFYAYDGLSPIGSVTAKQLYVGQRYLFMSNGAVKGYRVNTIAGNNYRVFSVRDPDGVSEIREVFGFTASTTGWLELNVTPVFVLSGTAFEMWVVIGEPDPTPTIWTANFYYDTPPNNAAPVAGVCLHANSTPDILRFAYLDDDAIDQSANLLALEAGDIIEVQGLRWAVQSAPSDGGTYVQLIVAPAQQAPSDGTFEFTFETVTATPISTVVDTDYWLGNPQVSGYYRVDGGASVETDDQYGIDIKVQDMAFSLDWDTVSYSG